MSLDVACTHSLLLRPRRASRQRGRRSGSCTTPRPRPGPPWPGAEAVDGDWAPEGLAAGDSLRGKNRSGRHTRTPSSECDSHTLTCTCRGNGGGVCASCTSSLGWPPPARHRSDEAPRGRTETRSGEQTNGRLVPSLLSFVSRLRFVSNSPSQSVG